MNNFSGAPPSDIGSYTLLISGHGMATIENVYSAGTTEIVIEIPAGDDRLIELTANIGAASVSAALSFIGSTIEDLAAGETIDVILNMVINETKLVIPDRLNGRMVQIDNIGGDNWDEYILPDPAPIDVDFDNQGRIYVGTNGDGNLYRIDNINSDGITVISTYNIDTLAVDRVNNYIYYNNANMIYRKSIDNLGGAEDIFDFSNDNSDANISGITVDEDGLLYIADNSTNSIFKYDPSLPAGSRIIDSYFGIINNPNDVLYQDGLIYVANTNGANNFRIVVLDTDLNLVRNFDTTTEFVGPKRFIRTINGPITFINEDAASVDQIIQLEDIFGTNWNVYGETGSGEGQFLFYI